MTYIPAGKVLARIVSEECIGNLEFVRRGMHLCELNELFGGGTLSENHVQVLAGATSRPASFWEKLRKSDLKYSRLVEENKKAISEKVYRELLLAATSPAPDGEEDERELSALESTIVNDFTAEADFSDEAVAAASFVWPQLTEYFVNTSASARMMLLRQEDEARFVAFFGEEDDEIPGPRPWADEAAEF